MLGLLYERLENSEPSNTTLHKADMKENSKISSPYNTLRRISTISVCSTDDVVYSKEIIRIQNGKYEYEDSTNTLIGRG